MNRSETGRTTSRSFQRSQNASPAQSSTPSILDPRHWSKKIKLTVAGVTIASLAVGSIGWGLYEMKFRPVSVFSYKLTSQDAAEVCKYLDSKGIAHHLEPSGEVVTVAPDNLTQVRVMLSQAHLPHNRQKLEPSRTMTSSESERVQLRETEDRIREMLLNLEGINDASVVLANPSPGFFKEDKREKTASISLTLAESKTLDEPQVHSIRNLVSHSVPELSSKNVSIVDSSQGRELFPSGDANDPGTELKRLHWLRAQNDEILTRKAETVLSVLGPDRFRVSIATEIESDKVEEHHHTHPGESNETGSQKRTESLNNEGGDKKYDNTTTVTKVDLPTSDIKRVRTAPLLSRISASVVVDNLPEAQANELKAAVAAAIGITPERGDVITMTRIPFHNRHIVATPNLPPPVAPPSSLPSPLIGLVGFAGLGVGLVGAFLLMGTSKGSQNKTELHNSDLMRSTMLVDLVAQKSGQGPDVKETSLNRQVQEVADLKTDRLAEALKSTWLSK